MKTHRMKPAGKSLLLDDYFSHESPPFLLCLYCCRQNHTHFGIQCVTTDATAFCNPSLPLIGCLRSLYLSCSFPVKIHQPLQPPSQFAGALLDVIHPLLPKCLWARQSGQTGCQMPRDTAVAKAEEVGVFTGETTTHNLLFSLHSWSFWSPNQPEDYRHESLTPVDIQLGNSMLAG